VLTFTPTDDASVIAGSPDVNYGSSSRVVVDGSPLEEFVLKFSVSGMNGRQPIGAKVRLYDLNPSVQGGDFHRVADSSWNEATVTWNNVPAGDAEVIASLGAVVANSWHEVDITPLITGEGAISLRVTSVSTDGADYRSKEGSTEFAPQLVVTVSASGVTPTPTVPPSAGDEVLVGAGDIVSDCVAGASIDRAEATAKLLDGIAGTVFTAGDNAYDQGTLAQYTQCYDPTWGRHKVRTKPAPGNHEYNTSGASGYYSYFGAAAGDPTKGYYAYDAGPSGERWRVYMLNSNNVNKAIELAWLQADLAAHPRQCTLAIYHHPTLTAGLHGNDEGGMLAIWQALYDNNADLVVTGHDHSYQRYAPLNRDSNGVDTVRGVRQIIVGTGGKGLSIQTRASSTPGLEVTMDGDTNPAEGVLKLTLHATSYDWEFIPVAGKTFTDSGTESCH
jgi:hypothetical protein